MKLMNRYLVVILTTAAAIGCNATDKQRSQAAPVPEVQTLCEEGRSFLAKGDLTRAGLKFKSAIVAAPNEAAGHMGMVTLGLAGNDREMVLKHLNSMKRGGLKPEMLAPWLTALAHMPVKVKSQDPRAAVSTSTSENRARTNTELDEASLKGADLKLATLFRAGRYQEVIQTAQGSPGNSLFRDKLKADAQYNLQKWAQAVTTYRKVLRQQPGNEAVTQYLADALRRLKRYDESIAFYRVLAQNNPKRPGLWRLIGDVAMAKKDDEVALAAYTKALKLGYQDTQLDTVVAELKNKLKSRE